MSPANPALDPWFAKAKNWQAEIGKLREILLDCDLAEELKWGKPTYTLDGANIVLIMPLKDTCTLLFIKGALLDDPKDILVQAGKESQAQRQMRFTSAAQISKMKATIKAYVKRAIEAEQSGAKIAYKKSADLIYPKEFQERLDRNTALREAFFALTPGRQRQYHLHFTGAKLPATRESRVEKAIPLILDGLGLNDR